MAAMQTIHEILTNVANVANGWLNVNQGTLLAGEDLSNNVMKVEQRFNYANVTATGTSTIKTGVGMLHAITINNPSALASATTATTIVIYDNSTNSGTKIGTISLPVSASIASALPFTLVFNDALSTGLTLSITLGSSGSWTPDITVSYR